MPRAGIRQWRGPAGRHQAERFAQRRQPRLGGGAAAEAGHRGGEAFQRIAHQRREHRLAPTLGELLQAAQAPPQRGFSVLRSDPGQQAEAQPDDGMGVGAERGQVPHGVAHQQAVVRRERQERRRGVGHGGVQPGKAAALDQQREAAGQPGIRQALHQLGERPRPARPEGHVERAVEPLADTDAAAGPFRIADQQLRRQRRRERAVLGRRGQARGRVVGHRHRAPAGGGRIGAVQDPPQGGGRSVAVERFGHDPRLGEQGGEGVEKGLVPGREAIGGEIRALRRAAVRQPIAQSLPEPLAVALQLVRRQHGRAGPGGDNEALGGHQRR